MNFGKSRARMTNHDEIKVTFANVAGLQEEKKNLRRSSIFESAEKICAGRCSYSERRFVGRNLREQEKHFLQKLLQERRECRFSVFRVRILWKCS